LLIASRFADGPSLIPAISKRSTTANHLELILPGLLFCRGASGIAQPHPRKIGVVSLLPRQGEVHESRAFLTVNTERSWQLLSALYHLGGTGLLLSTRKRLKAETLFDEVNILGLLVITPYLTKEHLHGKSIEESSLLGDEALVTTKGC
jgi:hypothetical protein